MNIQTLKECISEVGDRRRTSHGHVLHRFEDIIIIGLCTAISGGEDFSDMEMFGKERQDWLRRFLALPNGIPDADTFRRVFEAVDPSELGVCLRKWLEVERAGRGVVAVDGKTMRGSACARHGAYHVVSAFAAENQLVLREYSLLTDVRWMALRPRWSSLNGVGWVVSTVWERGRTRRGRERTIRR